MRLTLFILVIALALTACSSGLGRCVNNECPTGQRCDLSSQFCVKAFEPCTPSSCAPHQECDGTCVPRYSAVVLHRPSNGAPIGKNARVDIELRLAEGRTRADPEVVTFNIARAGQSSGTLIDVPRADAGWYSGLWDTPSIEGEYDVTAHWAGMVSDTARVRVDRQAPVFKVNIPVASRSYDGGTLNERDPEPGYQSAWRRDEKVLVTVLASTDVNPETVRLTVTGVSDGGAPAPGEPIPVSSTSDACGAETWCGQVEVDLSKPEMKAFRAQLKVIATGEDLAGNQGEESSTIAVTRWKWSRVVAGGLSGSPALDAMGRVILISRRDTQGTLHALAPDGTDAWAPVPVGEPRTQLVIGRDEGGAQRVYFGTDTEDSTALNVHRTDTGQEAAPRGAGCLVPAGRLFLAPTLALGTTKIAGELVSRETIFGVTTGTLGTSRTSLVFAGRPTASGGLSCFVQQLALADRYQTVAVAGGRVHLTSEDSVSIYPYELEASGKWQAGAELSLTIVPTLLTFADGHIIGGAIDSNGNYGVFRVPRIGGPAVTYPGTTGHRLPFPVVDASAVYFGGGNGIGGSPRLSRLSTKLTDPTHVPLPREPGGVPALAQGGRLLYVAVGAVQAHARDSLSVEWATPDVKANESSVVLDCARPRRGGEKLGGRPGVLYVTSDDGKVFAFVTDTRGIDPAAPWPMFQHDPRNTGNADTSLAEFACD